MQTWFGHRLLSAALIGALGSSAGCATARIEGGEGNDGAPADAFSGDCSPPTADLTGWHPLGGPLTAASEPGTPANLPSLTVDGDNAIIVAWAEGNPADTHIRIYDGTTWQPMGAPISENPGATSVSTPRVAARGDTVVLVQAEAGGLRQTGFYARIWRDSSWQRVGGGELSTETVSVTGGSVWFEPSGAFYVAWSQFGQGQVGRNRIRVLRFDDIAFRELPPEIGGLSGAAASAIAPQIAVDRTGAPLVVFSESGVRAVARNSSDDGWEPVGGGEVSAIDSQSGAHSPALAIDHEGRPILAVGENDAAQNASNGYVLAWNGSAWERLGDALNAHPEQMTHAGIKAIAVDGAGRPVVAWTEGNDPNRLYVHRYDGAGFQPLGAQPITAADGSTTVASASLITDLCGRPVVAFAEAEPGGELAIHVFRHYE